VVYAASSL